MRRTGTAMNGDVQQEAGRDPYDVLGLPRDADRQQVVRAFHRMARRGGHPDTGGDAATFAEIIRARDVLLLDRADHPDDKPDLRATPVATPPEAGPRPADPPPRRTSKLTIATVVLALLGPLFWPVAIVVGLVARLRIKRTGFGGGTLVAVVLFVLCILTLHVLAGILSLVLAR